MTNHTPDHTPDHAAVTEQIARYMYEQDAHRLGLVRTWDEVHDGCRKAWIQRAKDARDAVAYALLSGPREGRDHR